MPQTTFEVKLDLDGSGAYATDISAYVWRSDSLRISGRGRGQDLGAASPATLTLSVDNGDGRFSPKNASGAYYNNFHPYKGVRVRATYNAVTYDLFKGIIAGVDVKPHINDSLVYISAADFMWALERTSVRLPLMVDHHPGTIIQRLLDYAEIGEFVANPTFKDDLTGYALVGGASAPVRVTTGVLLHAPAIMQQAVSNASGSGWRLTVTTTTTAGQKVTEAAYVWAENAAAVGKTLVIRVVDNGGVRATSSPVTLSEVPQRLEVTGTYDGASTARYIEVVTNAVEGVFTFRTGAVHGVPFGSAYARSIEAGIPTLERVFFHEISALSAIQEVALNELGGLFYFDGAGVAVFEERSHRWAASRSLTSQVTIDERFKELQYNEDAQDRIGEVILSYPIWEKAATVETIASVAPLPRTIAPNGTLRVEIDFGGTARDIVKPVANTDYTINGHADGSGVDESANVTLAWDTFGGGAQAIFTNTVARSVYLTLLQVRGKPVRREEGASPARATPTTIVPYAAVLSYSFELNASPAHMESWANYLAARHGDVQQENLAVTIADPFGDMPLAGLTAAMLGAKVSDRITLTNDNMPSSTKVNADFYIDSLNLAIAGQEITADWKLVPIDLLFWILGTGELGDAQTLVTNTALAP